MGPTVQAVALLTELGRLCLFVCLTAHQYNEVIRANTRIRAQTHYGKAITCQIRNSFVSLKALTVKITMIFEIQMIKYVCLTVKK
jgi:hypothetical protein